jgi:bifunctional non-homologous end joining protein LigD
MSLLQYHRKRDFAKTPEPKGRQGPPKSRLQFVVQKHAARRLHYDFRLELDGTLKSWAVPKGPSLDPADKRLAVHVEDHPMAYGGFEGVIPEKQYGAGAVVLWDHGTWSPLEEPRHGYRDGHLKFRLDGEKLHGSWALVRMHGRDKDNKENWLLIKGKDDAAKPGHGSVLVDKQPLSVISGRSVEEVGAGRPARQAKKTAPTARKPAAQALPAGIEPELATLLTEVPAGDDWVYEVKFDGYRLLARIENGEARIFTRNGHDWTAKFSAIARDLARLPLQSAWLDGEACVLDAKGVSRFGALQRSLSGESKDTPLYMVFDVLWLDGENLREMPYLARKQRLAKLIGKPLARSTLRISPHSSGAGAANFKKACAAGLEGLIGKRPQSHYRSGRTREWIKLKCKQRQEFVIGGFTAPTGSRTAFGALLLGVYEKNGDLRYAGRVGTGFDEANLKAMMKRLRTVETEKSPFHALPKGTSWRGVRWVKPKMVTEIAFAEWTGDGLIRQAVFEGLREDKPAKQIGRERAMKATVAEKPARQASKPASQRAAKTQSAVVARITISHPDRIVFPDTLFTKLDVALYYEKMAPHILPFIKNRPLSIVRCPSGAGTQCFFQKHAADHDITGVELVTIEDGSGPNPYLLANTLQALVGLAQMGTIELHVWGATVPKIENPDTLILDLDPDPAVPFAKVVDAAKLMHALLEALGLDCFVKTTGGKGLHVVVPLSRRLSWDELKDFARDIAVHTAATLPDLFTAKLPKAQRKGKIFIDYLRNGRGATAVAPYSLRARAGATVAMPLAWKELTPSLRPDAFNLETVPEKMKRRKDPWADYFGTAQSVTRSMKAAVSGK